MIALYLSMRCVEIARFLRDNIFVKTLDLRGNNVQGKGATALAGGIKLNRSLRSLNLKWNAIGSSLRERFLWFRVLRFGEQYAECTPEAFLILRSSRFTAGSR